MLSRVVTENRNGSNVVTSRTRVDYDYTSTGIRSLSVDWNDANLNNSFATSERTGSVEYLVDSTNHTGYAQTIVETTKNAAGVATKRIVYTYGSDEISQTTYLPPSGGGAGWNAGTTLTFSNDAHTSVRMLTDAAGAIAQVFTYAAYGELIAIHNRIAQSVGTVGAQGLQSQAHTSLLYNGEAFDSRIGQLYLRARWYDGHRFTTLDPFFGNGSDPLSFNKYGFVHANPVMGIDPSGLMSLGNVMVHVASFGRMVGTMGRSVINAYKWTRQFQGVLSIKMQVSIAIGGGLSLFAGSVGRGILAKFPDSNETFDDASKRLYAKLESTQPTAEGKAQAKRIADAVRHTFENNAAFHFRAPLPNPWEPEMSLQKGLFCAEWANAFENAVRHEISSSKNPMFKVGKGWAEIPGDPEERIHAWINITSLSNGKSVYVDDAFSPGKLFIHDDKPVFGAYVEVTNRGLSQHDWTIYSSYDHAGKKIETKDANTWHW